MYEAFFGLNEKPFNLTPNWRYLFLTPMHREVLSAVQYGVTARRGLIMVVGEAGTGKTTVVRSALRALRKDGVRTVYLANPTLTRDEFLKFLARAFQLAPDSESCKVDVLTALSTQLARLHAAGGTAVLVVDEAQSMPYELLEEIRLLANFESATTKLLQVVLSGQPELADRLNDPSLRQLKQRVAVRASLSPLDLRGTAGLIAGRIRVAGGKPVDLFTARAIELVYLHSAGVPRTVNVICDNALVSAFALGVKPVGSEVVEEVCRDFDFPQRAWIGGNRSASSGNGAAPTPPPAASEASAPRAAERHDVRPLASEPSPSAEPHTTDLKPQFTENFFSTFMHRRPFSFLNWGRR
jgi:general secretion pathway protein A